MSGHDTVHPQSDRDPQALTLFFGGGAALSFIECKGHCWIVDGEGDES